MRLKSILPIVLLGLFFACGSSEKVITENGKVYEVKGNTFFNNGVNVTEQLTENEKDIIRTTLQKRKEAERIVIEKQETIAAEQDRLKTIQKEARLKEKELEKQQKALQKKLDAKEDVRQDFLKAKQRLKDKQEKYQELKAKGKLSPRDEEKWQKRLTDLEQKQETANQILNTLKQ